VLNAFTKHILRIDSVLSDAPKDYTDTQDIQRHSYSDGDFVYQAGDPFTRVYIVEQGWLTSLNVLANGGRQLLNFYTPSDLIGLEFLSGKKAPSSLKALCPTRLISIERTDFLEIMRKSPELMEYFISLIGLQDIILQERICSMSRMDAKHKIVYFLLLLKSKVAVKDEEDSQSLFLPLTQYDIADSLGLTNVTVSKVMSELEKAGYIQYKRQRIEFLDIEALTSMVEFQDRYACFKQKTADGDSIASAA